MIGGARRPRPRFPMSPDPVHPDGEILPNWPERWERLRDQAGIGANEALCVGLSGGADSVLLLTLVAHANPAVDLTAVHVDHGLRGAESEADASFCAELCARLGIRFVRRLEPVSGGGDAQEAQDASGGAGIEAESRALRYRALAEEARARSVRTVLVGHHADDLLETLLLRWMRGTEMAGLPGMRVRTRLWPGVVPAAEPASDPQPASEAEPMRPRSIELVRPLLPLRRGEVRELLRAGGIPWREDSSNESARFSRNRIRHDFLPQITAACGPRGLEGLHAFARAVERLEDELALRTIDLDWEPQEPAPLPPAGAGSFRGGRIARSRILALAPILRRRALWRLLTEGSGRSPGRALLDILLDDIERGRTTRRSLPARWTLDLRAEALVLISPTPQLAAAESAHSTQLDLPYPDGSHLDASGPARPPASRELHLRLPGVAQLPDGRSISAEIVEVGADQAVPRDAAEVELDPRGEGLETRELTVRWARPGDRFHGLGSPGSRPLRRFLADAGVPREQRGLIPLVFAGHELIWVAGIRPCENRRLRSGQGRRLRLRLLGAPSTQTLGGTSSGCDQAAGA